MIFQYDFGTPMYAASIELRQEVLRKPLGLKFSAKDLIKEINAFHFGVFDNCFSIIACLYLIPDKNQLHLKQMAVNNKYQRKGIGTLLIKYIEENMYLLGYDTIYLHARKSAIGFYENNGYKITSEEFEEVGIAHYEMKKKSNFFKKTY